MHVRVGQTGLAHCNNLALGVEHEFVYRTLRHCELAVDREGSGDVSSQVPVFATSVDEQEVSVVEDLIVLDIVQDGRILTTGDDTSVSNALGTLGCDHVLNGRLDLTLAHARLGKAHCLGMGDSTDVAGCAKRIDLLRRLVQPHLVKDRPRIRNDLRSRNARPSSMAAGGSHRRENALIVRSSEGPADRRSADESLPEPSVEVSKIVGCVGTESLDGAFHSGAETVPSLQLRVSGPNEERVLLSVVARVEYGNRVGFREPGQEEEVGVLSEGVVDVIVTRLKPSGWDDRDRVTKLFHESGTPCREASLIHNTQATEPRESMPR